MKQFFPVVDTLAMQECIAIGEADYVLEHEVNGSTAAAVTRARAKVMDARRQRDRVSALAGLQGLLGNLERLHA